MTTRNRLGRFRISRLALEKWHDLLILFAQIVVVQADYKYDTRAVEYLGYSDLFDEIPIEQVAPDYDFEFTRRLDGGVDIKCVRKTEADPL